MNTENEKVQKEYVTPLIEIIRLKMEDIITKSLSGDYTGGEEILSDDEETGIDLPIDPF